MAEARYNRSPLDDAGRPELRENPDCESHTSGYNEIFPPFSTFCVALGERRYGESVHVLLLTDCDIVNTAAGKTVLLLWTYRYTCAVKLCDVLTVKSPLVKFVRCVICSAAQLHVQMWLLQFDITHELP